MRSALHARLLWIGLGLMLSGRPASAASDETLLVIVHPSVVEQTWSEDDLSAIFTLTKRAWSNGQAIIPYNYDAGNKLREVFDRVVLNFTEEQAARFWIDFRIRGGGAPPRKVPNVATMVRVIARLPGAIGYVPAGAPTEGTKVVAKIENHKVLPVKGK